MPDIRNSLRQCCFAILPGDRHSSAADSFLRDCSLAIAHGATTVVARPPFRVTPSALAVMRELSEHCRQNKVNCLVVDDVLLNLRSGANGVLFTRCPESYTRVREIIGPESHIGREIGSHQDMNSVKARGALTHIDFCSVGRVASLAAEEKDLSKNLGNSTGSDQQNIFKKDLSMSEAHSILTALADKPYLVLSACTRVRPQPGCDKIETPPRPSQSASILTDRRKTSSMSLS